MIYDNTAYVKIQIKQHLKIFNIILIHLKNVNMSKKHLSL